MDIKQSPKFYHFSQNNSGGYFVVDDTMGICSDVIIESDTYSNAWNELCKIGKSVSGFWDYCGCCGERWYEYEEEGDTEPSIYGTPITDTTKSLFREKCFVHYLNGDVKLHIFKKEEDE